ncbi:MAG TPA: alpha/beta hydrolase [Chloroflexota bacterium]|nr:alpha/beta hydrolase [Chloroflexota bacterium]
MADELTERVCELPDGAIHYLEGGAGKPLVFLHGAGGVPAHAAFLPALAARFRVLAPSLPGFDASPLGDRTSAQDLAHAAAALVEAVGAPPVALVGESFGGWVACWLAVLHPALVDRLVLAAPAAFRRGFVEPATPLSPEELALRLFGRLPDAPPSPEQRARQQQNAATARRFLHAASGYDQALYERLPEITAPTLVLFGTRDEIVPPENGRLYQARIPQSHLMFLHDAVHSLPIAAEAQFVALTTEFVERGEEFVVNRGAATI